MTKMTINLPDEFAFRRSGVVFTVKPSDIPADMWARLAEHGIAQKVGDAAAGKGDDEPEARKAMQAVYDTLAAGSWGRERNGGVDPVAAECRRIVVDHLKAKQPDRWKALRDADDRDEQLDAIVAKQPDDKRAAMEELANKRIAEREEARRKREADAKAAQSVVEL